MPWPGGILGPMRDGAARGRRASGHLDTARRRPEIRRRRPGASPALGREPRRYLRLARDLAGLGVEMFATDGTREHLAADGIEVGVGLRPDRGAAARRRPGQDVPSRGLRGHPRPARRPAQLAELAEHGIGLDRPRRRQREAVRAAGRRRARRASTRRSRWSTSAAWPSSAPPPATARAWRRLPARSTTRGSSASSRSSGTVSVELRQQLAAEAFGLVAAYHAEIAAYLNQVSGDMFPSRLALVLEKVDDLRYGENPHQRAAFYRETTHRSGTLADASQIQGEAPSFNNLLDLDAAYRIAATSPRRRSRSSSTATRSGWPRTTSWSRPTARRSRPTRSPLRRHRGGQPPAGRRRPPARSRRILRSRRRARLQRRGARASCARRPASRSSPCRPTRPKGCATTASPPSTSSASPAGCSWRRRTSSASSAASSRSSRSAVRRSRS